MTSGIYIVEIIAEVLLMYFGFNTLINSFAVSHCTNVIVVLAGLVCNYINKNKGKEI